MIWDKSSKRRVCLDPWDIRFEDDKLYSLKPCPHLATATLRNQRWQELLGLGRLDGLKRVLSHHIRAEQGRLKNKIILSLEVAAAGRLQKENIIYSPQIGHSK
jgi:hypothetical protein